MSRKLIFSLLGLIITCLIPVLFILLMPKDATDGVYKFNVSTGGTISWYDSKSGREKLRITSNVLKHQNGQLDLQNINKLLNCGQTKATITNLDELSGDSVKCWKIYSARGGTYCGTDTAIKVRDCISMQSSLGQTAYWFGGAEMVSQKWPINAIKLEQSTSFLTSDLPKRFGNVLERYYLSSLGAAVFIDQNVPLFVSMFQNKEICLEASYDETQFIGPTYLRPDDPEAPTELSYAVCVGNSTKAVHQAITNPTNGLIERPTSLPDLKMLKDPIWSTWARYKASINQSVVENFAAEILQHNFTNSQLEIDDGYEEAYGDFTFDSKKFPDAKAMVDGLHSKGFRVTTWVTPFINIDSANYATGRRGDLFVPDANGSPGIVRWWNGRGAVVDFTNREASDWYKGILNNVKTAYGVDSFKFDAGETSYLPKGGLNFTATRCTNPGDYTTAYAGNAFEIGGEMSEMRSSWKTQNTSFFMRLMDKGSSWNSLRGFQTVIPTALTFSVLGYPFVLPDMIGGNAYVFGRNSMPERELYIRWIELGAFLPSMQFSISPWQYDANVTEIARRYVELHRTVVYDEVVRAANKYIAGEQSLPVAPIWFHASPDDATAFSIDDEFMVGDRYLVAPVLEEGSTMRDVYLPGKSDVTWRDKMKSHCAEDDSDDCVVKGGRWIKSYQVSLDEISWWEKLT